MSARRSKNNFKLFVFVGLFLFVSGGVLLELSSVLNSNTGVLGASTLLARRGEEAHNVSAKELEHAGIELQSQNSRENKPPRTNLTPKLKEIDIEEENETEIEDEEDGTATDGGEIRGDHFGARSHFPISINPDTNELIITTPNGTKTVAILPDKAVENILTKGILSKIGGGIASGSGETTTGSESADTTSGDGEITLDEENGELVYNVSGTVGKKLFGLLPVNVKKEVKVSADTGEIINTELNFFNKILDALSL